MALLEMTLCGTAFLYEGQELGMCHVEFRDSSEFRDVEAVNYYKKLLSEGKTEQEAFSIVAPGTRDQSRAPMQWTAGENAGFTTGTPWLRLNDNYTAINAEAEEKEENSVLNFYRRAIALRKQYKTLVYGSFEPVCRERKDFFGYVRRDEEGTFYVELNLSCGELKRPVKKSGALLLGSYGNIQETLRPYEANLYRLD